MQKELTIFCDGGARGNPGPGALGVAIYAQGELVKEVSKFVGEKVTNNFAEYQAIIESLRQAIDFGASKVQINVDSQLVERQLKGEYRVKSSSLRPLWQEARKMMAQIPDLTIVHVVREKNKEADRLVNEALDSR